MNKENKVYQIRYNTNSTGPNDRWRLINNNQETLVSDIVIDAQTKTTKDYIEGVGDKYHITCEGILELKNGVAHIQIKRDDNAIKRHIFKTITYRLLSSFVGFIVIYYLTGNVKAGGIFSVAELIYKPFQYYIHERLWYKFGKIKNK